MTGPELFPLLLPANVAVCIVCHVRTEAPVAVREIHSTSGPGTTLWACPEHAPSLAPGPMPGELYWP